MEFFNPSISAPLPSQRLSVEVLLAMVRNLAPDLRQRLMSGETLSARVVESSPKSVQIDIAGRVYRVDIPEARLPSLTSVITLRYHPPKAETVEQTVGQNRNTPVQIRLDGGSVPRSPTLPQTQATPVLQSPQNAAALSAVNGLLVRAEMLKPIPQTAVPQPGLGLSQSSSSPVDSPAMASSHGGLSTPAVKAQPSPIVQTQSPTTITTNSSPPASRAAISQPTTTTQTQAQAQTPAPVQTFSASPPLVQNSNLAARPVQSPAAVFSSTFPVAVPSSTETPILGTTVSRQRTAAPVIQTAPNPPAVSVPEVVMSPTKPDTFHTSSMRATATPSSVTTQATDQTVIRPAQATVSTTPNAPTSDIAKPQPTATNPQNATPQKAQPVAQTSLRLAQPAVSAEAAKPALVAGSQTGGSHQVAASRATQQVQQNPNPPASLSQQTTIQSNKPVLARFTQSYQQVQQQTGTQNTAQVSQLAQWTDKGQNIQLQVYDPRLARQNAPQIQGTAVGTDQGGRTILNTVKGQIAVQFPSPIPKGAEVIFIEPAVVHSATGKLRFSALESLLASSSSLAVDVIRAGLPKPGPQMSHAMLFFLMALRQNSGVRSWWGGAIQQEMQLSAEKLSAVEEEFHYAQPAPIQSDASWQSYSLPLQVGGEIVKLLFYWRGHQQHADDTEDSEKNIFAIEGYHHDIGRFRLDGQFLHRQLNVQWASDRPLDSTREKALIALYYQQSELYGMNGQIQFQLLGDRTLWMDEDVPQDSLQV